MALLALMLPPVLLDTSMVITDYDKVLQRTVQQKYPFMLNMVCCIVPLD